MQLSELEARLPGTDTRDYRSEIEALRRRFPHRIVVLDDDPTGIQTVHGCRLYTSWDAAALREALKAPAGCFYLLLNSRSLPAGEAERRCRRAVETLVEAARGRELRLLLVSRSDSTLRGHFPLEPETIRAALRRAGRPVSGLLPFCPALLEAGRYTFEDIQYVEQDRLLVPAHRTEFARDAVFGYTGADLREYIVEKSRGRIHGDDVASIAVEELRASPVEAISARLAAAAGKACLIFNALAYADLYKLAFALLSYQLDQACDLVVRSSSSFVPAAAGLAPRGLLRPAELFGDREQTGASPAAGLRRGLVVVGSYVKKSGQQLAALLAWEQAAGIEIDVRLLAAGRSLPLTGLVESARRAWREDKLPVFYTSREEIRSADTARQLELGERISRILVRLVRRLEPRPDFLIAKGGISSQVILSEGLRAGSARVLGQIAPGVPVVLPDLGERRSFPYVVFPGNVGGRETLREIAQALSAGKREGGP
jgi:uncharacterized protein YgbK (DUF1537 family)